MIPAKENKWFIAIFRRYVWLLFYRRFKYVWLRRESPPEPSQPVIYYGNHNSWWDGIIPFLLNEYVLGHRHGRAMMEEKQMRQYPFFSRIGAFSIDLEESRSAVSSLRYAVRHLSRPDSCLFIYPEGRILPATDSPKTFKAGLGWLLKQLPEVSVIPLAVHLHTLDYDKPELFIHLGKPVAVNRDEDRTMINEKLQHRLATELHSLRRVKNSEDAGFKRIV